MVSRASPTNRHMLRRKRIPPQQQNQGWRKVACIPLFFFAASVYVLFVFETTTLETIGTTTAIKPASLSSGSQQPTACKYHGNCPSNSICEDNICVSFLRGDETTASDNDNKDNKQPQQQLEKCVQACLPELRMDERYYRGMMPQVVKSYLHGNLGCVIQYQQRKREPSSDTVGTLEEWIDARFRRLVRVDVHPTSPSLVTNPHDKSPPTTTGLLWNAFCRLSCEADNDCPSGSVCVGRPEQTIAAPVPVHDGPKSCERQSLVAENTAKDMVIVTGSDQGYYNALRNFAASLKYWAPERKLVVYNLGMSDLQLKDIPKWTNVVALKWESGIPQSLPPHVHTLKNYAWKSIVINETVHEYKSIFWLDAGASFTGPIDAIEEIIHHNGIFLVRGQDDDMKKLSHPGTYQALGYNKDTFRANVNSPHYAGGIQGHVYPSHFVDSIVIPNAQCAMDVNCIAPKGSGLSNHRFDQTSLSILAYQTTVQAPHYTEYLAAGRDQLNDNLRQPSEKILWTSRGGSNFYSKKFKLRDEVTID